MSNITVLDKKFYKPIENQFISLIDENTFKKEVSFAVQALRKNSYLQRCDANSVLQSVLNISQTGLSLNPVLNYAYLVPHKGKCVLYPSYQGLCKLATDTGSITSISCQLIFEGDLIDFDLASDEKVKKHVPYFLNGKDKGKILGGYSIALLKDGSKHIEYMTEQQILDIREYSESYKAYKNKKVTTCVWVDNPEEMYRKTIVKRHFKYLPKSVVSEKFNKAIELDNSEYDFHMTYEQGNYIESLLLSCSLDQKTQDSIWGSLSNNSFTQKRAQECIEYLKDNQIDNISSGNGNYTQGDIQKKLNTLN